MVQKEYDIFISYRRVGGADKARILKTELEARGYKVFLDYDELKDGVFDKRIMDAIDSSPIFMFLLTPNSLERCINEDDWVRREIEYAVDNRKHFIPINPDCTFMSLPDNLSDKIKEGLGQHQFTDVMFGQLFNASINELIKDRIRPVLAEWGRVNAASSRGAIVRIEADLDCRILRFGKEIGLAQSDDIAEIKLPKGKHKLQFVGLENSVDSYECLLSVEDFEYEYYIEVKLLDKYNARKEKEDAERKAKEFEERMRARIEAEKRAIINRAIIPSTPKPKPQVNKSTPQTSYKSSSSWITNIKKKWEYIYDEINWDTVIVWLMGIIAVIGCGVWGYFEYTKQNNKLTSQNDNVETVSEIMERITPVELNGKYGYVNKTGKEVIPFKYDYAYSFSEGLAAVKLNGKWRYIDKTGKEVIPLKYDNADSFSEGLAVVKLNGKWCYIDKTGKEVIPLKYDAAWHFSEGLARVELNGKFGFIDKTGKEVIPLTYHYVGHFNGGLVVARLNGKCGFIDKTGEDVIPLKYDSALPFQEGLARVSMNGKCGFIDKGGNEVIPLKYDSALPFQEGLARVRMNGKCGFIDKGGNEVIPLKYDIASSFHNGNAKVKLNGEEFYIDKNGNRIE